MIKVNSNLKCNTLQKSNLNNCLQYFNGVLYPNDLRGLVVQFPFDLCKHLICQLAVPFGMYWRISPFVFSFAPSSQE